MTVDNEGFEYNILGCNVRIKSDEENQDNALKAIDIVNDEIEKLKTSNPSLKDLDVAVLAALKLASEKSNIESEYKDSVFTLRSEINEALAFINEISPDSAQADRAE